eukprot:scaffold2476_cov37-Phaeocystis_antarctica.AAC.2
MPNPDPDPYPNPHPNPCPNPYPNPNPNPDPFQSNQSMRSEPRSPVATKESTPFTWSECHNLIPTDAAGVLVRQPSASSAAVAAGLKVSAQLQLPCNHIYPGCNCRRPGCNRKHPMH